MRRLAFNVFAILSLLVFVISVCIWVRSYFVGDMFYWMKARTDSTQQPPGTQLLGYGIYWGRGAMGIMRMRADVKDPNLVSGWRYNRYSPTMPVYTPRSSSDRVYFRFGKFFLRHTVTPAAPRWISRQDLTVPLWLFLPAAVPPLLWLRRRRRTLGPGFPITPTAKDQ